MDKPQYRPGERRENFRVKDSALITWRAVSSVEATRWRDDTDSALPDAFELASWFGELRQKTTLLHRQAHQEAPRLAEYVSTLDQKLDRLMEVLLVREMALEESAPQSVDVGADGLGFQTRERFERGQLLELQLLMLSTGTGLRLLGEVVRCNPAPDAEGTYDVGVSLEYRREADRELLLHHLLHRQSELIRERNQTGAPDS